MSNFKDYFFPKNCLQCRAEGAWLCESCREGLSFTDGRFCPFCGRVGDLFRVCKKCGQKTGIKKVFSLLRYSDPLARKIIKNFKYRYVKDMARELDPLFRKFFIKYKKLIEMENAVLVPVPLHWYKECDRGFNQAEELAKIIGKILGLPIENKLIFKKLSKNQAELEKEDRYSNLCGRFFLRGRAPKNIIIADDVFTTGSTVKEMASVLKSAGAENIQVITLARG